MTAQLVSTGCVYWLGNSPCCCCCWCCFCPGCNYELCWFNALIWTTSISLLIGRRTVWTGHSSTERPSTCRYMRLLQPHAFKLLLHISINLSIFKMPSYISFVDKYNRKCSNLTRQAILSTNCLSFLFVISLFQDPFSPSFHIFDIFTFEQTFQNRLHAFFSVKQKARKNKKKEWVKSAYISGELWNALPVEVCGEAFDEHARADWHCRMSHSRGSRRMKRKLAEGEHR